MATPPAQQSASSALGVKTQTPPWMHYMAWGAAILGPVVMFMPPRRVGFQAVVLASGTFVATNQLAYDYTGTTIWGRFQRRFMTPDANSGVGGSILPEKALRTQELLRLERERREAALPEAERKARQEEREKKEAASRGVWQRLWMGDAKEDWREERRRKEKEALDEGKGYGDLIVEQVKEVFSSSKEDEGKRQDVENNADNKK